ncbi:MAG: Lrp/AsnC ligand binding domain-containing protein [Halobacteriales archaeon]|nr:Lrp/AsnC ligand binding domain-containing protein [Halobacteriales archaeon]
MVHAFIMVKTAAGSSEGLVEAVRDLEGVVEAHVVAGEYDVITEIEAEEVYDVLHTVSSGIQELGDVTDTKTYITLD